MPPISAGSFRHGKFIVLSTKLIQFVDHDYDGRALESKFRERN